VEAREKFDARSRVFHSTMSVAAHLESGKGSKQIQRKPSLEMGLCSPYPRAVVGTKRHAIYKNKNEFWNKIRTLLRRSKAGKNGPSREHIPEQVLQ